MGAYSIIAGWRQYASCRARTDRPEVAVDLPPPLHQVVIHLQSEEEPFRHSEIAREPEVGVGGEVTVAHQHLVYAAGGPRGVPRPTHSSSVHSESGAHRGGFSAE